MSRLVWPRLLYPEVEGAALRLKAESVVLDGEIVALDPQGRPSFQALQHRGAHAQHVIVFYAFDVLHLNGDDVTRLPLEERRAKLPALVKGSGLLVSQELRGSAAHVVAAVQGLGLEGVIAKRRDSRYDAHQRSGAWVKLKLDRQQEFVVGGYRPGNHGVDALLVGYYDGKRLRFAGKVRAGFTSHVRRYSRRSRRSTRRRAPSWTCRTARRNRAGAKASHQRTWRRSNG